MIVRVGVDKHKVSLMARLHQPLSNRFLLWLWFFPYPSKNKKKLLTVWHKPGKPHFFEVEVIPTSVMRSFLPNTEAGPSLRLYRAPLWSQAGATRSGGKVLLPEAVGDVELRVHYTHTNTNFWLWESARDTTTNTRALALSAQMGPLCIASICHSTVQKCSHSAV